VLQKLQTIGRKLHQELKFYQLLLTDRRTPKLAKVLLWLAVGYLLLPFDLIPDFLPVIGHLDDAIIIPALVILALKIIPAVVVEDCRVKARDIA
jgi:uncharacterized membrane protein YkvA (DUF1232 family)